MLQGRFWNRASQAASSAGHGILLVTLAAVLAAVGCRPNGPPSRLLPPEVPAPFRDLVDSVPSGITYYVAIGDPCASNTNDGLGPTCGGGHGPFRNLRAMYHPVANPGGVPLLPGDELVLREGVYGPQSCVPSDVGFTLAFSGTSTDPIRIRAYPGESAVLDGGYRRAEWEAGVGCPGFSIIPDYSHSPVLRITASWVIVEGLGFTGCYKVCILLYEASDFVLQGLHVEGGLEDGIKTTTTSRRFLVWRSDFYAFVDQAIDVFGAQDAWIVADHFHDSDGSYPALGFGIPVWTKGGARDVYYIENDFHDLIVSGHALILGGCCWNNWGGTPGVDPVAMRVEALRNTFSNVRQDPASSPHDPGVLGVEGCSDCLAEGNWVLDSDSAFSIGPTHDTSLPPPNRVAPRNITFRNNGVLGLFDGRVFNTTQLAELTTTTIDENTYRVDDPVTFRVRQTPPTPSVPVDWDTWRSTTGFDANSTLGPMDPGA